MKTKNKNNIDENKTSIVCWEICDQRLKQAKVNIRNGQDESQQTSNSDPWSVSDDWCISDIVWTHIYVQRIFKTAKASSKKKYEILKIYFPSAYNLFKDY